MVRPVRSLVADCHTASNAHNRQSHSGPWANGQWETGTLEMERHAKETTHHGTLGFWESVTVGQRGAMGQRDKETLGQWTSEQWTRGQRTVSQRTLG